MAWYSRFQFILSNGRQVSAAGSYWSVRSIYPQLLIGVGSVESSFWPPMTNIFSSGSCTTLARERVGARLLGSVQVVYLHIHPRLARHERFVPNGDHLAIGP